MSKHTGHTVAARFLGLAIVLESFGWGERQKSHVGPRHLNPLVVLSHESNVKFGGLAGAQGAPSMRWDYTIFDHINS